MKKAKFKAEEPPRPILNGIGLKFVIGERLFVDWYSRDRDEYIRIGYITRSRCFSLYGQSVPVTPDQLARIAIACKQVQPATLDDNGRVIPRPTKPAKKRKRPDKNPGGYIGEAMKSPTRRRSK